jgi:hypothetical protein
MPSTKRLSSIVTLGPNSCPVLFRVPACCPFVFWIFTIPQESWGIVTLFKGLRIRKIHQHDDLHSGARLRLRPSFTTKQAIRAGFAEKVHAYHVNARNWIREHRGIYRLSDFRAAERPDLTLWYLWSQNRQEIPEGVYSHNTALSLHELSDLMPSKLQMTVPKDFRRSSAIPEILVLHRAHLEVKDIQEIHGVRVTRPLRTIVDLLRSGNVDRSQVKLAVEEAIRRGLIARREIDRLPHDKLQRSLQELAGQPA